jgi:hypothetical protein
MRSSAPDALEAAREARAAAELLEPAEHAQLAISSSGGSSPACRSARAAARPAQRLGEPAHRLRALGARVLDVVRLVEHERLRLAQRQPRAVRVDDLVVEDRDVGGAASPPVPDTTCTSGAAASARSRAAS